MTGQPPFDLDRLAAYADGELSFEDAAAVEAAIAADPALAEQVDAHRALRARLSAHFAPILDEPVPDRLSALLAPRDNVVDLAAARRAQEAAMANAAPARRVPPRWAAGGALAASLALGLVLGTQLPRGGDFESANGRLIAHGALEQALTARLAGMQGEGGARILISFRTAQGHYCRGFETAATAGIACREDGSWAIVRSAATGGSEAAGGYRQAGSAQAAIMALAQDMAAGPALDAAAERAARDAGWTH